MLAVGPLRDLVAMKWSMPSAHCALETKYDFQMAKLWSHNNSQLRQSPSARPGFSPRGDQARIQLANGAQIIAPPGKDLLELSGDANNCLYGGGGGNVELYFTCLHERGDILQFPDGRIWGFAPQYGNIAPSSPAPYTPGEQRPETSSHLASAAVRFQNVIQNN